MTIENILNMDFVDDDTEIIIRNDDNFHVLAKGNWYQDNILIHYPDTVKGFTWQDDNKVYIDVEVNE